MATHAHGKKERLESISSPPRVQVPASVTTLREASPEEKHEDVVKNLEAIGGASLPEPQGSPGPLQTTEPSIPEKKKGGRPLGSKTRKHVAKTLEAPAQSQEIQEMKEGFTLMGEFTLDFLAGRLPNKMPVTREEKALFSRALSLVLEKYVPNLESYGPEVMLLGASILVIGPRLVKPKAPVEALTSGDIERMYKAEQDKRLATDQPKAASPELKLAGA
jgi:hypothetical protein